MNETMYWLTVVATIFLPLTFLTGFFGMNFGWLVGQIDTEAAFLTLGVGGSVAGHGAGSGSRSGAAAPRCSPTRTPSSDCSPNCAAR